MLKRDIQEQVGWLGQDPSKRILDLGGGQGQLALFLAAQGHHVTLVDISQEMLDIAAQKAQQAGLQRDKVTIIHSPLQDIEQLALGQFDLVFVPCGIGMAG